MTSIIQQLSRKLNQNGQNKALAFYLLLNALILISLIPGGAIETRDFSHIPVLYLTVFNAFLTALGMCSLLFVPLAFNNFRAAAKVSKILALAYIAVYLFDLFEIFPQTPSAMPTLLLFLEISGVISGFLLFAEGHKFEKKINTLAPNEQKHHLKKLSPLCILILVIIGNAIVIFSTYSAINSGDDIAVKANHVSFKSCTAS